MKRLLLIILLLSGWRISEAKSPKQTLTSSHIQSIYSKAKLVSDKELLQVGLNCFIGKKISELFPVIGIPDSSLSIGDNQSFKYIYKENLESSVYTTYYDLFGSEHSDSNIVTTQKQLTINFLTDNETFIKEYYINGNSDFYMCSLAFKFIDFYPLECEKNGDELINIKTKLKTKRMNIRYPVDFYYCKKCLYGIKFNASLSYMKNNKL